MTAPAQCPDCGGAVVAVLTKVRDDIGGDLRKHVHYRCQDVGCPAHVDRSS